MYGGGLEILINNDRLEVWFSAPDKSHSKINATFWPKKHAELVYSTDPTLASSVWTFSLDTAGLDRSKKETLKNFWFKWGDTPLSDLNKAGSQKRPMNYSFAPTTVYEPLPDAPLELHWEVPAGVQRDFSIPVAQLMAGKKLGGGRLSITAYPEHVELWFEENGALFNSKKNQKRLIYSSAS